MHDLLQIFVQIYSFKFFIIYIIIVIIAINSLHILFRSTQYNLHITLTFFLSFLFIYLFVCLFIL